LKSFNFFSKNICKNILLTKTILENIFRNCFGQLFVRYQVLYLKKEKTLLSRSLMVDFILFSLFTLFYFTFLFLFLFLFLEQLRLRFISHAVTSVTNWWQSHKTDHGTWKNGVEGSGTKWHHTAWKTHAGLMLYSWSFRVECTVASTDHGK